MRLTVLSTCGCPCLKKTLSGRLNSWIRSAEEVERSWKSTHEEQGYYDLFRGENVCVG